MKKLTLIIPCYNEADALPLFAAELNKVIVQLTNYNTEVLLINDGSSDQTLTVMKEICASDSHYKYISFSRNFGKEAAMYAGFCNSDGDYAAVMDADMQDPPSLLPEMLNCLETEDYDSVATRRVSRIGEPPIRSFFARKFYKLINRISDANIVDGARDFRLMRKEMVDSIVSMCEYNRFSKVFSGGSALRPNGSNMKTSTESREKPSGTSGDSLNMRSTVLSTSRKLLCPLLPVSVFF